MVILLNSPNSYIKRENTDVLRVPAQTVVRNPILVIIELVCEFSYSSCWALFVSRSKNINREQRVRRETCGDSS